MVATKGGKLPFGGGKGGKSYRGKGGKNRRNPLLVDNWDKMTQGGTRRLCRRGGVKRISALIYEESKQIMKAFMEKLAQDAVCYTDHAGRKTVMPLDVVYALKRQGRVMWT